MPDATMQLAGQAYRQFCDRAGASLAVHHDETYQLSDGTRMRILRHGNDDRVFLTPPDVEELETEDGIPHGFVVTAPWATSAIYKRSLSEGWSYDKISVPQTGIGADNQVIVELEGAGGEKKKFPLPLVAAGRVFWDWAPHGQPLMAGGKTSIPINMQYGGKHEPHPSHYVSGLEVMDEGGQVRYVADPLLAGNGEPAGAPLPPATDNEGKLLALNVQDKRLISPTMEIYEVRTLAEHVSRMAGLSYARQSRKLLAFNPDWNPGPKTTVDDLRDTLGRDPDAQVWIKEMSFTSAGTLGAPGVYQKQEGHSQLVLIGQYSYDGATKSGGGCWDIVWNEFPVASVRGETADVIERRQTKGTPHTYATLVALPSPTVSHVSLKLETYYPVQYLWEAGDVGYQVVDYASNIYKYRYGYRGRTLYVRGIERTVNTTDAKASLILGWAEVSIVSGSVKAELGGRKEWRLDAKELTAVDRETNDHQDWYWTYASFPGNEYNLPWYEFYPFPTGGTVVQYQDAFNAAQGANAYHDLRDIVDKFSRPEEELLVDKEMKNAIDYEYSTRYVIDHDYRAKFVAMIRVTVKSTGNRWKQDPSPTAVRGRMVVVAEPTYQVTVAFEWRWGDSTGAKTLGSATFSRPAFECPIVRMSNPFVWPRGDPLTDINAQMPPIIGVNHRLLDQLRNLADHQGTSPYLAAKDADVMGMDSEDGIEFSYVRDGQEIPHEKVATGMIYHRTFKVSDFDGAWALLEQLKIDCRWNDIQVETEEQDAEFPRWFYCPELGEAVEKTVHHIELRDGVEHYWSDTAPVGFNTDGTPKTRPPRADRNITLRRV